MPKIILIETSTSLCSTALSIDGKIVEYRQSDEPKAHASLTAVFIKEMIDSQGLKVSDCDAVCVSSGPGSYTGLRVGVSSAKGLCFASNIPLISVCTLDVLATQGTVITNEHKTIPYSTGLPRLTARNDINVITNECEVIPELTGLPRLMARNDINVITNECEVIPELTGLPRHFVPRNDGYITYNRIIPMIDARRMEVYSAIYDSKAQRLSEVEAHIVNQGDFAAELDLGSVLFIGDGANKCSELLKNDNSYFVQEYPKACFMAKAAEKKFANKEFENLAYFEPFYLKQFTATVSKKKLF